MTAPDEPGGLVVESARSVVSIIADSLSEHGRHAADLASRASDPGATIDPIKELSIFSKRAIRDGAYVCQAAWTMLEALARTPTPIPPPQLKGPPTTNPVPVTVGPVGTSGQCQLAGLRRRGDTAISIPGANIDLKRNPNDPAMVDLVIAAGSAPRGLYEGEVKVGSAAAVRSFHINVYIDWPPTA